MANNTDKMEVWKTVHEAHRELDNIADALMMFIDEERDTEAVSLIESIKEETQKIRSAVHDLIRPDLED